MTLEFNFKYKNYEILACPKHLVRFKEDEPNVTIDFVKHVEHDGKKYCFSLAYFIRDSEGYDLRFVGNRPFKHIEKEDVKIIWCALKHAQEILDEFWESEQND